MTPSKEQVTQRRDMAKRKRITDKAEIKRLRAELESEEKI